MLFKQKKRIAAFIMAVVLLVTTANFVPESTKANDMASVGTPTDSIVTEIVEEENNISTELMPETSEQTTESLFVETEETITDEVEEPATENVLEENTTEEVTELTTTEETCTTEAIEVIATDTNALEDSVVSQVILLADDVPLNRATGDLQVADKYWGQYGGEKGTTYVLSNGVRAYCIQHSKNTAPADWDDLSMDGDGTVVKAYSGASYFSNKTSYLNMLRALYWFQNYHSTIVAEGGGMISSSLGNDDIDTKHDYAVLCFALSYYNGDNHAGVGNFQDVQTFMNYLSTKPYVLPVTEDDDLHLSVTSMECENFVTVNGVDKIKSDVVKLVGSENLVYYFTVPSGLTVEVYNKTGQLANSFSAGSKARIRGGESMYLYADITLANSTTSITNMSCEQSLYNMTVYVPVDDNGTPCQENDNPNDDWQTVACAVQGVPKTLSLNIKWNGLGAIKIHKKPSDQAMADSIDCYSDLTATFGVYDSYNNAVNGTNAVKTFTTNSDGEGSVTELPLGTYYVKELVAPKNYEKSDTIYTADVNSPSVPVEFDVVNYLYLDPLRIVVKKEDPEGRKLQGAEFEIKYYGLQQDTPNPVDPVTLGYSPIRTWVIRSDEYGDAQFRDSHKVSGHDFWLDAQGNPAIPVGTITIQETKAPEGYVIDPTIRVQSVKNDADLEDEHYYQTSTIPNTEFKAYIKIIKVDKDSQKPILNNNATFKIWSYDDNAYVSFNVNGTIVSEFITDNTSTLITPGTLGCGKYRIDEIECPEGYYSETAAGVDLSISTTANYEKHYDANGNVITDMGTFVVTRDNTSTKGYIELNKRAEVITWDKESGKYVSTYVPKAGVVFDVFANTDIYSPDGQNTIVYQKGERVAQITTDTNGYAKTGELYLGEFRVVEHIPDGYVSVKDQIVTLSLDSQKKDINQGGVTKKLVYETVDVNNVMQRAKIKVYKTDETSTVYLEGAEFELYEYDAALSTNEDYISNGVKVSEGVTDSNGELVFYGYFPLGDYAAIETKAPRGYITDNLVHVIKAEYDNSGIEYIYVGDSYINDSIKGSINLTKRDMEDKDKTLEGVKFNLYKVVNDESVMFSEEADYINGYKGMSADEQTKINSFKLNTDDMFVGEFVTDENGEIHIDNLCYGEYYFIETETLYRYNINETPQNFVIDENGVVYQMDVYNDGRIGTLSIWGYDGPGEGGGHHKTGDNAQIMIVFFIAALSLVGIVFVLKRKKYAGQ